MTSIYDLNKDILWEISTYLNHSNIVSLCLTSKILNKIFNNREFWKFKEKFYLYYYKDLYGKRIFSHLKKAILYCSDKKKVKKYMKQKDECVRYSYSLKRFNFKPNPNSDNIYLLTITSCDGKITPSDHLFHNERDAKLYGLIAIKDISYHWLSLENYVKTDNNWLKNFAKIDFTKDYSENILSLTEEEIDNVWEARIEEDEWNTECYIDMFETKYFN